MEANRGLGGPLRVMRVLAKLFRFEWEFPMWLKIGTLIVCGILLFIFIVGGVFEIRRYLRNLKKDS